MRRPILRTAGAPCRSYRNPLDVGKARIAHQYFDSPRFRQFKHRGRLRQVDVHIRDCRDGLKNYPKKLSAAFGPLPQGDGIAPASLKNTISFTHSLRWLGQVEQPEAASHRVETDIVIGERRHRLEAQDLALPLRPLTRLAEDQEPGRRAMKREAEEDWGR